MCLFTTRVEFITSVCQSKEKAEFWPINDTYYTTITWSAVTEYKFANKAHG